MRLDVCCSLFAISFIFSYSAPRAETFVVNPDGTGDFATIQAAVAAAQNGDVIELTDGTFTGAGNRDVSFLDKSLTVRSQSGNPSACIVDCETTTNDPHRGFLFQSGETSASLLEGITIKNGGNPDQFMVTSFGGAIFCDNASSPTIRNCDIVDNDATLGAGIYCEDGSSPFIDHCRIMGNDADQAFFGGDGGGIYCENGAPTITGCFISSNSAVGNFGGGGGAIVLNGGTGTIVDCLIFNNFADGSGGGIACVGGAQPRIERCVLYGNVSASGAGGGLVSDGAVQIISCSVADNCAIRGAGIYVTGNSAAVFERTIIWGNGGNEELFVDGSASLTCSAVDSTHVAGSGSVEYIGDNVFEDPLFCNPVGCSDQIGDYRIEEASPCAPANSPGGCGLIGALGASCQSLAVERTSWGVLKGLYR